MLGISLPINSVKLITVLLGGFVKCCGHVCEADPGGATAALPTATKHGREAVNPSRCTHSGQAEWPAHKHSYTGSGHEIVLANCAACAQAGRGDVELQTHKLTCFCMILQVSQIAVRSSQFSERCIQHICPTHAVEVWQRCICHPSPLRLNRNCTAFFAAVFSSAF